MQQRRVPLPLPLPVVDFISLLLSRYYLIIILQKEIELVFHLTSKHYCKFVTDIQYMSRPSRSGIQATYRGLRHVSKWLTNHGTPGPSLHRDAVREMGWS